MSQLFILIGMSGGVEKVSECETSGSASRAYLPKVMYFSCLPGEEFVE